MAARTSDMTGKSTSNISETVYAVLRKNIINLTLAPGTLISETDVAERLSVSRTPVREAFIRLSHEALVSIFPQKGTFVSKIDLSRVQEERFLRESLECEVIRLFANYHSEQSIERLKRNLKQQQAALEEGSLTRFIEFDDQFHAIMFEETNKQLCYQVLKSYSSHYRRIRYLSMFLSEVSAHNIDQHQQLLAAIEDHDSELASSLLKHHIRKLIIEKDDICEKYPEYFQQEERFIGDSEVFGTNKLDRLMGDHPSET
jgi:GntR family transcriptional regulator, rspAB operon transcriptional repressor